MRIMALDVGDKTIGVAVTDEMGWTAQGLDTIRRTDLLKDLQSVLDYVDEFNVETLVVGLPLRADGEVGTQAEKVLKFKEKIENYLSEKHPDLKIETWDESMTTHEAYEILAQGGLTSKKRKKVIDKLAAVFILESYLRGKE